MGRQRVQGPCAGSGRYEDHARRLACDRYWIATKTAGLTPPWTRTDLVEAQVLAQPRHPTDGPFMILEPIDQI